MTVYPRRPTFDRQAALGWRDQALDGLNCVLRCVEAVLRFHGLKPLSVARTLNGALDPVGRDLGQDFDGCQVHYRTSFEDGTRNVPFVLDRLGVGEPIMVLPDRFHLPGDVYEGRYHFHDHAVLAIDWSPERSEMTVLDTDGDPNVGFRRHWEITPATRQLFTWIGTVELTAKPDDCGAEEYFAERVGRDTPLLISGAAALSEMIDELIAAGLDLVTARALHVLMLGDIQPQLFIYSHALAVDGDPELPPKVAEVRATALAARVCAKRLGMALIAAHEKPDPLAVYPRALQLARPLQSALDRLGTTMVAAGGTAPGAADPGGLSRLRERFAYIKRTCFPLSEDVVT